MKRVAIYARVSTDGQTTENQLLELRATAQRHGWQVVQEFVDHGISGAKGRDQRPAFDAMLKTVTSRQVDMVMAWSVDRLGRSLQHLVEFLGELRAKEVDLFLQQQGLDTSTPAGRAMFQMLGVFSEFERAMIRERVVSGLDRARAEGKQLGRPKVGANVEAQIRALRTGGMGIQRIASTLGVGVSVVQRVVAMAIVSHNLAHHE
ncbi:MAG: recombinase family protein [Magnetococcales bacterium]|nr:recombinase family protein [Magnetococcales bacterium]